MEPIFYKSQNLACLIPQRYSKIDLLHLRTDEIRHTSPGLHGTVPLDSLSECLRREGIRLSQRRKQ